MSKSNTQKVIKGISSQTIVTLSLGVVEITSFSIMSRLLSKEDFGYYAAITAIVTIFSCFSDAGIGSAVVQRKDITKRYVDNAFTLSLIFGSVVALSLFMSSRVLARAITDESMTTPLMLMSVTLLLNCLTSVNISLMYRRLQFLRVGIINFVSLVITTIVAVYLAWRGFGYYAIIIKAILTSVLTLLLSFYFAKTRYGIALDKNSFKQIFGFSGWLMASGLFRNLAHDIDKLLMTRLLSVASLGAYNRPKDFINQISSKLNGIFDTALFPVLSGIQDNHEKIVSAYKQSLYFMNIFAMLITLGFSINSELIIRIFFGEQWIGLRNVTIALSFLMLFNIDGRLADCFLRSLAMTKQQFFFRILETIVSLLGVVLGALWDIIGVAIAVVITNMFLKLLKIVYISYKIEVPINETLRVFIKSWRFTTVLLPVCVVAICVFPKSLIGGFCVLLTYVLMCLYIFLVCPSIVGKEYELKAYQKVRMKITSVIRRIN